MIANRENNTTLSTADFNFICQFVYDSTGIVLNESKREMVYRRLTRIARDRKLSSFSEYCQLLKTQPEKEIDYFVNAITTNLTSFFREKHHFDGLSSVEIPKLLKDNAGEKRLRIWSSACSTGEEPYSIAITLLETIKQAYYDWDIKILATDIDSNVLAKAKRGVYSLDDLNNLPKQSFKQYFHKGVGENDNKIKVDKKLQDLITFKQLNLMGEWPMQGHFDVVFCRNVIIYFDKPTQEMLFSRYYEILKPGGILILGHSENLGNYQKYFENAGRTMFRKPFTGMIERRRT